MRLIILIWFIKKRFYEIIKCNYQQFLIPTAWQFNLKCYSLFLNKIFQLFKSCVSWAAEAHFGACFVDHASVSSSISGLWNNFRLHLLSPRRNFFLLPDWPISNNALYRPRIISARKGCQFAWGRASPHLRIIGAYYVTTGGTGNICCIFVVGEWVKLPTGGLATFRLGVGVSITGANYSQSYFFADMAHPINDSFYQYSAYERSAYFLPLITVAFFGQPLIVFFCPIRKQQIGCWLAQCLISTSFYISFTDKLFTW